MLRKMEDIVTKRPTANISDAKKEVISEYEAKYQESQPNLWDDILSEMGSLNNDW